MESWRRQVPLPDPDEAADEALGPVSKLMVDESATHGPPTSSWTLHPMQRFCSSLPHYLTSTLAFLLVLIEDFENYCHRAADREEGLYVRSHH